MLHSHCRQVRLDIRHIADGRRWEGCGDTRKALCLERIQWLHDGPLVGEEDAQCFAVFFLEACQRISGRARLLLSSLLRGRSLAAACWPPRSNFLHIGPSGQQEEEHHHHLCTTSTSSNFPSVTPTITCTVPRATRWSSCCLTPQHSDKSQHGPSASRPVASLTTQRAPSAKLRPRCITQESSLEAKET